MIVQWCIKGMSLDSDRAALQILNSQVGLMSNWWRSVGLISPAERQQQLTPENLNKHVNHFKEIDPDTGVEFAELSPFISLAAGTVERDAVARSNRTRSALLTALRFGTQFGTRRTAYLFTCWVMVAPRPAVSVESVAEEIRDLNSYRSYSAYQLEGEVTAKIHVPDNQIQGCQRWDWDQSDKTLSCRWEHRNPRFTPPHTLSNVRELIVDES